MKLRFLLPLILVSTAAQADIIPDRKAMEACEQRFKTVNREQNLLLRRGPVYTKPSGAPLRYRYYFNARNGIDDYRVVCQAHKSGRVQEFALERGRWVYESAVREGIAAN